MANVTANLKVAWKIVYYLPNGVRLPIKGKPDWKLGGKNQVQRFSNAYKYLDGFKGDIENVLIYEVGQEGKLIAMYDKDSKTFMNK